MACVSPPWGGLAVKENPGGRGAMRGAAAAALWLAPLAALLLAARLEQALPAPLPRAAPPHLFSAERARDLLINLTALGPRVTGSYENEVAAVAVVVAALRRLRPPPHSALRLDIEVQRADGAFTLDFLDGMSNIYRGVQSVVARVSGAGAGAGRRAALLLNCHFDTVADSAGAADDAAGCAVLLEAARALLAGPAYARAAPPHDLLLLFNGAEENIMQASHAFVTQHRWARRARAFVNLEACGAGGRELLFQSTARGGALLRQYAARAPRPYASSLAQEIFRSGLVPADTDFRIFRDFGGMDGVDLAWSSDGYAYHTALDAAPRVPPGALQRAGDNVLALVTGVLESESLTDAGAGEWDVVYFDVLGLWMVLLETPAALLWAAAALLALAARLHLNARDACKHLLVARGAWARGVAAAAARLLLAAAAGLLAPALLAAALHSAGHRLTWYARPWLLAPLYGAPALSAALLPLLRHPASAAAAWPARWRARAACDALALLWGGALLAALLLRPRLAYLPAPWVAALAAAAAPPRLLPRLLPRAAAAAAADDRWVTWSWALCASGPTLQALYVSLSALALFVPLAGRAGTAAPPDVLLAELTAAPALLAAAPVAALLPLHRRRHARRLQLLLCGAAAGALLLAAAGAPYTPHRPQRYMLLHVRRTRHAAGAAGAAGEAGAVGAAGAAAEEDLAYWLPALDVNTPHSVVDHVPALAGARGAAAECVREPYCGAPYYLPALSLLPAAYRLPAAGAPRARLGAAVRLRPAGRFERELEIDLSGPAHVVLIVSPAEGVALTNCSLLAGAGGAPRVGPRWGRRDTYLLTLADAAAATRPAHWRLALRLRGAPAAGAGAEWARLSLAGHAMFGPAQRSPEHERLLRSFPPWTQVTGWGVDMHLYTV